MDNVYEKTKEIFYDSFNNTAITELANDFANSVNGMITSLYRLRDGIHIGVRFNTDDITENEILDIFGECAREFVLNQTHDAHQANYVKDNIASLTKRIFIDSSHFTIII
jgi:hypothetical protein